VFSFVENTSLIIFGTQKDEKNNYQTLKQRKMKKILLVSALLIAFTAGTFAQSTDTEQTTATATIVGPLALTKVSDMNFGTIAVTGTAGTVVLGTDNSRTAVGPSLVPPAAGIAASFTVSGDGNRTFAITLPANGTVTLISGANTMAANDFVHSAGVNPALSGGTAAFTVGATLSVGAAQASGIYTSANFPVTVSYN
jgi:hypothetical protein